MASDQGLDTQRDRPGNEQDDEVDAEHRERTSAPCQAPRPAATPTYAAAGMVVTEMATPTAKLARVSKLSIAATPAAAATQTVVTETWVRLETTPELMSATRRPAGRPKASVTSHAATTAVASPGSSVPTARANNRGRRAPPHGAAVSGSRSGLTAIAPTMRTALRSSTPNAAITPATAM